MKVPGPTKGNASGVRVDFPIYEVTPGQPENSEEGYLVINLADPWADEIAEVFARILRVRKVYLGLADRLEAMVARRRSSSR